jgi:hypothetical protein
MKKNENRLKRNENEHKGDVDSQVRECQDYYYDSSGKSSGKRGDGSGFFFIADYEAEFAEKCNYYKKV